MGDFYDFINHWIGDFCAGSKMPIDFRKQGTMLFAKLYNTCTQEENGSKFVIQMKSYIVFKHWMKDLKR